MFGCDQTVTLTHLHYDGDADRDVSEETTLTGVSWYGQAKTAVDSTGLHAAQLVRKEQSVCRCNRSASCARVSMPHPGGSCFRLPSGDRYRRQDHLRHRDRHRAGRA